SDARGRGAPYPLARHGVDAAGGAALRREVSRAAVAAMRQRSPRSPCPDRVFVLAARRRSAGSERLTSSTSRNCSRSSRRVYVLLRPVSMSSRFELLRFATLPPGGDGRNLDAETRIARRIRLRLCPSRRCRP